MSELVAFDADLNSFDVEWNEFSALLPASAIGESIIIEFQFISDDTADDFSGWSIDNVEINVE